MKDTCITRLQDYLVVKAHATAMASGSRASSVSRSAPLGAFGLAQPGWHQPRGSGLANGDDSFLADQAFPGNLESMDEFERPTVV
jgi:hypothetical protein